MFFRIGVVKNFANITENTCTGVKKDKKLKDTEKRLYLKKTPTHGFFSETCEIFKNTFFT